MGRVRTLVPEDIPEVAAVHQRAFSGRGGAVSPAKNAYFREVFLSNPWYDESVSSLVYEDDGKITGFLGVVPRRMSLNGEPVQVAVSTCFSVDPDSRSSLAALHLSKEFLSGPQDMSIAESNDPSRRIWERLGGTISLLNSVIWMCPLRPAQYIAYHLTKKTMLAPIAIATKPLLSGVDAIAARIHGSPIQQHPVPRLREDELSVDTLLSCLPRFSASHAFKPEYDEHSLDWLFSILARKNGYGNLRKTALRDEADQIVGWYVYYLKRGGVCEVVQIVAGSNSASEVFDHLCYDAWRQGAMALSGRMEPRWIGEYPRKACLFARSGGRMLVNTHNAELLNVLNRGDAFLSRLEEEWWIPFHGDTPN